MKKRKSRKIFITGTDTGVGKTIVTLAIALYLQKKGIDIKVVKPIETGCKPTCEDINLYTQFLGKEKVRNYFSYEYPAAPWTSARMSGENIDFEKIVNNLTNEDGEIILIEGAGGLLVPITEDKTYLDLILALEIPVIIVAGNKLGVINHTLLTVSVLAKYNINGIIILNDIEDSDPLLLKDNLFSIKQFSSFPVVGRFPKISEEITPKNLIKGIQPLDSFLFPMILGTEN